MTVKVLSRGETKEYACACGENLLDFLQRKGYAITARCGGTGKCGKCRVKVLDGHFSDQRDGYVLACKAVIAGDASIEVFEAEGGGLAASLQTELRSDGESGYGLALDIGTTTLAFSLTDMRTGKELDQKGVLNRQCAFGADVLSRITAAAEGKADGIRKCLLDQIRFEIKEFQKKYAFEKLKRLCVCGNTTMLHFFMGKDVSGIGQYPFEAEFLDTVAVSGVSLGLDAEEVLVLPSVAAYFGADAVAGALAVHISDGVNLIADIGTNGEILLAVGGKLYATSTAAGPCFEGANIECGTGGVFGAIDRVRQTGGKIEYSVIGGGPATGICGAGLVDAIAVMLQTGVIDETGAFTDGTTRFYIGDSAVYVSQKDVRAYQLAKSAICAGIRVLMRQAGVREEQLDNVFVAGGFGFYVDTDNAVLTGLFPEQLRDRTHTVGNAALLGTRECLVCKEKIRAAERIAVQSVYTDLSTTAEFMDEYIANMDFGEKR